MYVEFGNENAVEALKEREDAPGQPREYAPLEGRRVTQINFPDGIKVAEAFSTAVAVVGEHFAGLPDGDGTHAPKWVESDSAGLAALLGEHFDIPTERPNNWEK